MTLPVVICSTSCMPNLVAARPLSVLGRDTADGENTAGGMLPVVE